MSVAHVKAAAGSNGGTGTPNNANVGSINGVSCNFNYTAAGTGNLVLFWINWGPAQAYTGTPVFSVTATGWAFTQLGGVVSIGAGANASTNAVMVWAIAPNTSAATFTVTVSGTNTPTGNSVFFNANIDEWSGHDPVSPIDNFNSATGSGTPTVSLTPVNNDCAIWVAADDTITGVGTIGGTAATLGSNDASNDYSEYRLLSGGAGTTLTCNFTGSGTYGIGVVSIKPAPYAQVQKKTYASTSNILTHSITLDAAPTTGNLLILGVVADLTVNATPTGWTAVNSAVDFTGTYLYYRIVTAGLSATTSVSLTGSDSCVLLVYEYSGNLASPLDNTAADFVNNGNPTISTGTTTTTAQADELAVALVGSSNASGVPPTLSSWTNSFTQQDSVASAGSSVNVRAGVATRVLSATGTYTTNVTPSDTANHDSGIIATFKLVTPVAGSGTAYSVLIFAHLNDFNQQALA